MSHYILVDEHFDIEQHIHAEGYDEMIKQAAEIADNHDFSKLKVFIQCGGNLKEDVDKELKGENISMEEDAT